MTTLDERHGEGARDGPEHRGDVTPGRVERYRPAIVPLDQPGAALPRLIGSKAANLARAARAGLPVLPGFVIPPGAGGDTLALRRAWDELADCGARPLVVRSSSPQEDTEESSLAGQFASVLDVHGWRAFRTAVQTVLDSAHRSDGSTAPMAVLVQPMLTARAGGVMFGADPVEGRADRILVSAVRGGPDSLVSGAQAGTDFWLSGRGRLLRSSSAQDGTPLTRSELFRLARLARQVRRVFGGPQDIEFGFDADGRLWLFQSRPITATAPRPARGARLLGPGPVAETLPEQLAPLEQDLWVAPMARGLATALDLAGTAPRRLLKSVPVVTTVSGRAAADLRLLGTVPPPHRWLALLNPAPGARRLAAAWRTGRLASSLPGLAADLAADVDRHLAEIPSPTALPGSALATELRWTRRVLASLHAQEALAGALLDEPSRSRTAAGTALAALAEARARGVPEERLVATDPVILALTAPSLRGRGRLPGAPAATTPGARPLTDVIPDAGRPTNGTADAGPPANGTTDAGPPANGTAAAGPQAHGTAHPDTAAAGPPAHGTAHPGSAPHRPHPGTSPHHTARPAPESNGSRPSSPRPHALASAPRDTTSVADALASAPRGATSVAFALYAAPHTSATAGVSQAAAEAPARAADAVAPRQTPRATASTAASTTTAPPSPTPLSPTALPPREALRLRIRWVQELQVRLVREVARRTGTGVERLGLLRWAELAAVLDGEDLPDDLHARVPPPESPPLPDTFRLAEGEVVVAERGAGRGDGVRGVSAGRAVGTVWDGTGPRPAKAVLVVRSLDPALAPLLPGLTGLVAQTGSPLSHLAVLAREFGLPAVVGATDAVRRFPPGTRLTIDGTAGDVRPGDAP